MNNTAKDLVLPAPKTPAMHRSDFPVMIASKSAMARIVQKNTPGLENVYSLLRIHLPPQKDTNT